MTCPIGCGKVYSKYLYVIYIVIIDYLIEIIISLDNLKDNFNFSLFNVPELKNHTLIKNLFLFLGFIIFGLIFFYIFIIKNNKKEQNLIENMKKQKVNSGLIHNKKIKIQVSNSTIEILIVSLFFSIFYEIDKIFYSLGFYDLDLWGFNIIFTIFFIKIYFTLDQYSHQLYSLIFVFFVNLIFLIISSFLPLKKDEPINSYDYIAELFKEQLFCIPIYLIFILNSYLISFSRVKSKVLMEFNYISPYKIIILIGFSGLLITSILLTITSIFKCEGRVIKICDVEYKDGDNNLNKYEKIKNERKKLKMYSPQHGNIKLSKKIKTSSIDKNDISEKNKLINKNYIIVSPVHTTNEQDLLVNKSSNSKSKKLLINQPTMRYKPRTDLERVYDVLNAYHCDEKPKEVIERQLKSINLVRV